jgi:hypothetical protein
MRQMDRRAALAHLAALPVVLSGAGGSAAGASKRPVLRPEDFRRAEQGSDDAPSIQSAIVEAVRAGGIVRLASGKTYRLESLVGGSDISSRSYLASLAIPPGAANLTFDFNGATLLQAVDGFTFGSLYRKFNDRTMEQSRREIRAIPRIGDIAVRTTDASGISKGSRIMLVSGNVSRHAYVPIAEMFSVIRVEGSDIVLDRPVTKDHSLAAGKQTGIIDISEHSARAIELLGPGKVINHFRRAGHFIQIDGFAMRGIDFEGTGGFSVRGRAIHVADCSAVIVPKPDGPYRPYAIAFDTGSSEITLERFRAVGSPSCFIHLHEGLSNVRLTDVAILNDWQAEPTGTASDALSIRGISWNIEVENLLIANNPQGGGVVARQSKVMKGGNSGLELRNVTLRGKFRAPALVLDDSNSVRVTGLNLADAAVPGGRSVISLRGAKHRVVGHDAGATGAGS